jgi:Predicted periplasmic protein (DUF2092)
VTLPLKYSKEGGNLVYASLLLMLVVPSAEPNEAEQLFHAMESKVLKAKTVDCCYEVEIVGDTTFTRKGMILLGEAHNLRFDMSGEFGGDFGGKYEQFTFIWDGTKKKSIREGFRLLLAAETPKWLGEAVRAGAARGGIVFVMTAVMIAYSSAADKGFTGDELQVGEFKLGNKEMVNKHPAQIVQYTLIVRTKDDKGTAEVSVWIDTKTQLPLKRVLTVGEGDKKATFTETFSKLTINEKMDPKQFELPRE